MPPHAARAQRRRLGEQQVRRGAVELGLVGGGDEALHLTEEERKRASSLLDQGEVAPEGYLFLKRRVLDEAASAIKKQRDNLRARIAELRKKLEDTFKDSPDLPNT